MPQPPPPDWFEVSVDEARGLIKLSFEGDTYVRFFTLDQVVALVAAIEHATVRHPEALDRDR